jgi:hypothetical protein
MAQALDLHHLLQQNGLLEFCAEAGLLEELINGRWASDLRSAGRCRILVQNPWCRQSACPILGHRAHVCASQMLDVQWGRQLRSQLASSQSPSQMSASNLPTTPLSQL